MAPQSSTSRNGNGQPPNKRLVEWSLSITAGLVATGVIGIWSMYVTQARMETKLNRVIEDVAENTKVRMRLPAIEAQLVGITQRLARIEAKIDGKENR